MAQYDPGTVQALMLYSRAHSVLQEAPTTCEVLVRHEFGPLRSTGPDDLGEGPGYF